MVIEPEQRLWARIKHREKMTRKHQAKLQQRQERRTAEMVAYEARPKYELIKRKR